MMESERALEVANVEGRVATVLDGAKSKRVAGVTLCAGSFTVAVWAPFESLVTVTPSEEADKREGREAPAKAAKVVRAKVDRKGLIKALEEALEEITQMAAWADGFAEGVK